MSSGWVFLFSYLVNESTEVLQSNEILHVTQFIKDWSSYFLFHCSLLHHTTFRLVLDCPIWQKYRAVILDFFLSGVGGATPVSEVGQIQCYLFMSLDTKESGLQTQREAIAL